MCAKSKKSHWNCYSMLLKGHKWYGFRIHDTISILRDKLLDKQTDAMLLRVSVIQLFTLIMNL